MLKITAKSAPLTNNINDTISLRKVIMPIKKEPRSC